MKSKTLFTSLPAVRLHSSAIGPVLKMRKLLFFSVVTVLAMGLALPRTSHADTIVNNSLWVGTLSFDSGYEPDQNSFVLTNLTGGIFGVGAADTIADNETFNRTLTVNVEAVAYTTLMSPTATASSGLDVTYGRATLQVCTVNHLAGLEAGQFAGTCTVTAHQFGDATYAPASPAAISMTVQ